MWCRGSQVSMHVVRGSPSLFSSHGRGIGPENVLKKDSPGLSWVAHPGSQVSSRGEAKDSALLALASPQGQSSSPDLL